MAGTHDVAQASSLWGLVLASTKPHRLEACATKRYFRMAPNSDGRADSCMRHPKLDTVLLGT